ncbi:MAG: hypothetical protein JKY56_03505, partial [Kofleriaceae bacterium]|nr:hypothetical protein [Kofleriaceae bacterium]
TSYVLRLLMSAGGHLCASAGDVSGLAEAIGVGRTGGSGGRIATTSLASVELKFLAWMTH